jgi:Tfp pilus assembly pilus retraction ATPase PilT
MNTTTELLQQLNTMQSEHIKTIEDRIKVLKETIKTLDDTIKTQEDTIKLLSK